MAEIPTRGPRARTRRLLLQTAITLMQAGGTPTIGEVAEAAEVSRATAYRCFPSHTAMVAAVVDEALGPILSWHSEAVDVERRVSDLLAYSFSRIDAFEATFRAELKHSLEAWAQNRAGRGTSTAHSHRGRRLRLLRDAVAPLESEIPQAQLDRLVHGLALTFGVEGNIVLKDLCGLDLDQANKTAIWAARALVRETLRAADDSRNLD